MCYFFPVQSSGQGRLNPSGRHWTLVKSRGGASRAERRSNFCKFRRRGTRRGCIPGSPNNHAVDCHGSSNSSAAPEANNSCRLQECGKNRSLQNIAGRPSTKQEASAPFEDPSGTSAAQLFSSRHLQPPDGPLGRKRQRHPTARGRAQVAPLPAASSWRPWLLPAVPDLGLLPSRSRSLGACPSW